MLRFIIACAFIGTTQISPTVANTTPILRQIVLPSATKRLDHVVIKTLSQMKQVLAAIRLEGSVLEEHGEVSSIANQLERILQRLEDELQNESELNPETASEIITEFRIELQKLPTIMTAEDTSPGFTMGTLASLIEAAHELKQVHLAKGMAESIADIASIDPGNIIEVLNELIKVLNATKTVGQEIETLTEQKIYPEMIDYKDLIEEILTRLDNKVVPLIDNLVGLAEKVDHNANNAIETAKMIQQDWQRSNEIAEQNIAPAREEIAALTSQIGLLRESLPTVAAIGCASLGGGIVLTAAMLYCGQKIFKGIFGCCRQQKPKPVDIREIGEIGEIYGMVEEGQYGSAASTTVRESVDTLNSCTPLRGGAAHEYTGTDISDLPVYRSTATGRKKLRMCQRSCSIQ